MSWKGCSFLPAAALFCPAITYCPQKNTAVLLISALNPYAVTPERRTDSNPHRRYSATLQIFVRPVTWWWPVISAKISYRAEIWIVPGVQRFANLWGTPRSFRTSEKNKSVLPCREFRGSANLDSAHPNNNFALTKLNSFAAPRPLKLSLGKFFEVFQTSIQLAAMAASLKQN